MNKMIELKHIHKSFGGYKILDDVSLSIDENALLAIMGKSGSGKSTLLNIITGQQKADSGEVLIYNKEITSMKDSEASVLRLNHFGYINQNSLLFDEMTVWENITLPMRIAQVKNKKEIIKNIEKQMDLLEIKDIKNQSIFQLSGGQKQRVSIVRALSLIPRCLIADEPTGNLDKENSDAFMSLIKLLHNENKMATVLVTHDEGIAKECDEIKLLTKSQLK
jgi:putative ABC transport system ATP-binding protein